MNGYLTYSDEDLSKYQSLYKKANKLLDGQLLLSGNYGPHSVYPAQVEEGIQLMKEAHSCIPSWQAAWIIGKAYQVLNDHQESCNWFKTCWDAAVNTPFIPEQNNILREYAVELSQIGNHAQALAILEEACALFPDEQNLKSNLSVVYLFNGKINEAEKLAIKQLDQDPSDYVCRGLLMTIKKIKSNEIDIPKTIKQMNDAFALVICQGEGDLVITQSEGES